MGWSSKFDVSVNNAFYFVIDKLVDLQNSFLGHALSIGKVVLLIAILSAVLNYALTGTGLKENIIKILKATVFFFIVISAYPNIIGFITSYTFKMAEDSIYEAVKDHFNTVVDTVTDEYRTSVSLTHTPTVSGRTQYMNFTREVFRSVTNDNEKLFSNLSIVRKHQLKSGYTLEYTVVPPASVIKIVFFLAGECFEYADNAKKLTVFPEFSVVLKGLVCAFFLILTGVFALLEYIVCFLEFMLVASVGVILFPLSIWEGSKFMAEKFIGAIVGFFLKLLFCNIAIFLMIYGFVSLFYTMHNVGGFTADVDQIVYIIFVCIMFFFICKSAPGLAQSLLTGTPSLSASGAISAVGGAVAAAGAVAGAVGGAAQKAGRAAYGIGGNIAGAGQAAREVRAQGGTGSQQAGAFLNSFGRSTGDSVQSSLSRNLLGIGRGRDPATWQERRVRGTDHAREYSAEHHDNRAPPAPPPTP